MTRIAFMISRMIVLRFLAIIIGLSLFVLSLEVVAYSREITAIGEGSTLSVLHYILLRAPNVISTFLPMCLLLAILLAITELSYRNELTAIWAMGISPFRIIAMLAPMALLAGVLHVVLLDRAVPAAAPTLRDWGIGDYGQKKLNLSENDPLWLRSGTDIMRAAGASDDSRILSNVVIFKRDEKGLLLQQIFADRAERKQDQWHLAGVTIYDRENMPPRRMATALYGGDMRPALAGTRSGDPEELTSGELRYFSANDGFGIRPAYVYETALQRRITPALVPLIMMALCIPLAARFRRGGGLGMLFAAGVGLGFAFFVFDGFSQSFGELGLIPPWMAAWTPLFVFTLIAAYMTLGTERV